MRASLAVTIFCFFLCSLQAQSATIRIPADQPTIQAGIDAAVNGDTVLVAPGTYTENIDFLGKAITVISEAGPETTIIDGSSPDDPDFGSVVTFRSGEGPGSVLEGFTLTGGRGASRYFDFYYYSEYRYCGGAVYIEVASPTLQGNIMTGALDVDYGGGVYCRAGSPHIRGNTISGNDIHWDGGGICSVDDGRPMIIDNVITTNSAWYGGAIYALGACEIFGNTINANTAEVSGGGIYGSGEAVISRNLVMANQAGYGGGIRAGSDWDSNDIQVTDNLILGNMAERRGGGIYGGVCIISGNTIVGNVCEERGGGLCCSAGFRQPVTNNLIHGNEAGTLGGGIHVSGCNPVFINCTVANNDALEMGGGLCVASRGAATATGSILVGNSAPEGPQVKVHGDFGDSTMSLDYSDLQGGQADINIDQGCTLVWGDGMIDADPLFTSGPEGEFYLGQLAAGQPADSPCLDTGNPASDWICGTTRTDGGLDQGPVDMGYHYATEGRVVAGPGPGENNMPLVRVFVPRAEAAFEHQFMAYGSPRFGVNVSCGDLDGNSVDEIITGAGPGPIYGPHVRAFDFDGTPLPGINFIAYGTLKWGVNVCCGDLDGDGRDEIVTGAGPGAVFGPHVRAFAWDGKAVSALTDVSFFAYGTPKWGVNVSCGDIDGDGIDEIVTGAGPGAVYGPHVRGFNVDGGATAAIPGLSFFAYSTLHWGVNISCGDIDGDGIAEMVTAPGPSPAFGAEIRGWRFDGGMVSPQPGCSFFAWPPADRRFGARVWSGSDLDGDNQDEIYVASGPDPNLGPQVSAFQYEETGVEEWHSWSPFPVTWNLGANVAAGRRSSVNR